MKKTVREPAVETLHSRIQQRRIERQLTQQELANTMNTTINTVSAWENGRSNPRIGDLDKLCEVLECSIDWLIVGNRPRVQVGSDTMLFTAAVEHLLFSKTELKAAVEMLESRCAVIDREIVWLKIKAQQSLEVSQGIPRASLPSQTKHGLTAKEIRETVASLAKKTEDVQKESEAADVKVQTSKPKSK
jgi:transcriptional regulator with XRE-family HTH domain